MFFDIGANIGNWAKVNINTAEKIISVEASPKTFNRLVKNTNNPNILCLNYAVCNNNGEDITFYDCDVNTISTINKEWITDEKSRFNGYTAFTEIKCKTITIDSLIEQCGMPELIKIDVEGGEYECVSSLTQKVPMLCFEWAAELNDITIKCLDHLQSIGFTKFYIQNSDDYTFRPSTYKNINEIKDELKQTKPKESWGMIWCV